MNLINLLFLQLTLVIVILGTLMNLIENYLPVSIKQMFRYGKYAYKGKNSDKLVERIEIPKSWFSHFYVFALIWSWFMTILAVNVYFFDYRPHPYFIAYLDFSCGSDRQPESKLTFYYHYYLIINQLISSNSISNSNCINFNDYSMHTSVH